MLYYVFEMQDGAVLSQAFNRTQLENGEAISNFYSRCASAAISTVRRHTIMLVDDKGNNAVLPNGVTVYPATFEHEQTNQGN